MAFYKALVSVWKEIESIQNRFLWRGSEEKYKIVWVAWNKVCKLVEQGGLRVKKMNEFNITLLHKWKWRILVEPHGYRNNRKAILDGNVADKIKIGSTWWNDLINTAAGEYGLIYSFADSVSFFVGDGTTIHFWSARWVSDSPLKMLFPYLFQLSSLMGASFCLMGSWASGAWNWGNFGLTS